MIKDFKTYNDALMRIVVKLTPTKPYNILGWGSGDKFNCQDWAELVRQIYDIMTKSREVALGFKDE